MDIDSLFSCFEETNHTEKSIQIPNVKWDPIPTSNTSNSFTSKRIHENDGTTDKNKRVRRISEDEDASLDDISLKFRSLQSKVQKIETAEGCTHEVVIPPNQEYVPLAPISDNPAKVYSFTLDPFQKEAVLCIDNLQSVLVSAHTSAGKTVVAEYAVAVSLKHKQRVIYTTPIKALSNQKYREFAKEFHDVGLITGDVTINPSASCLIMTTEILRNMLYRGSEVMREVGWVIFDEIHYMRDKERGVVWEETLILLPDNVHYVFLSATIPNARQFAEWVCRLHAQPCHVVYTEYRPTPLQHYIFPAGGDGMHLVVDEKGIFKEDNFNEAMTVLTNAGDAGKGDQRGRKGGIRDKNQAAIFNLVYKVMEKNFGPVIIFSFSKKDCEEYAMQLAKLDLNITEEQRLVDEIFTNAMDVLSEEDRKLPQVESMIPFLRRGIGIHHGGLLPILKETIEILFGAGLIKALFATETFAMGLNMPAKSVIFTSCSKFDGKEFRHITSGEYIQMSGRAGRRGLDDKGIVILMIDQRVTPTAVKGIVQGKADPLNSAFHLTYSMVLNLLRVEEVNPEYMLKKSFFQFQNEANIGELVKKVKKKQEAYDAIFVDQEELVTSYCNVKAQLAILDSQRNTFVTRAEHIKRFLQLGRLVKVKTDKYEYDWGMIVNFRLKTDKAQGNKSENKLTAEPVFIVNVLVHVKKSSSQDSETNVPCPPGETGVGAVVPVHHTHITKISSVRLISSIYLTAETRKTKLKSIAEIKKRYPEGPPLLDPIKNMKITDPVFIECVDKIKMLEERLTSHPLHNDENRNSLTEAYAKKQEVYEELILLKAELRKGMNILQMEELKKRKRVLRRMGYCTSADVIELKGRIACELSSADELLLTELIFNGVFNALSPEQCAALVSCFVCDEGNEQVSTSGEEMRGVLRQLQEHARRIAKVSVEATLDLDEDQYVSKFKCTLMDVVLAWAKGASFMQICKMTDVFEGSIVRCMRRLEEVLRQLSQAATRIGNTDLENKFTEAITMLKRDIIFAASLYM